jgi:hypothetical protein
VNCDAIIGMDHERTTLILDEIFCSTQVTLSICYTKNITIGKYYINKYIDQDNSFLICKIFDNKTGFGMA